MTTVKVVVVGDEYVGKSCLIITHSTGSFPKDQVPVILSILSDYVDDDNDNLIEILFYDTFGSIDFDDGRHLLYRETDVFLICFSLVDRLSLQNVQSRWCPEVRKHCPQTPIILIGLKSDLRQNTKTDEMKENIFELHRPIHVTFQEGLSTAISIGAFGYVECSAITKTGLTDINKLLNKIINGYPSISNPEVERRKSTLGNWIVAIIFVILVFVVLYSRYSQKK